MREYRLVQDVNFIIPNEVYQSVVRSCSPVENNLILDKLTVNARA